MTPNRFSQTVLLTALALAALAAPAGDALARRRPPPVEAPAAAPPAPAGPVALPAPVLEDAASYEAWLQRVTETSPAFTDGDSVARALKAGAAYDASALIRGAIAYAAIAALRDRVFVQSVRDAGTSPENRRLMVGYILTNPVYVFQFKDSDAAAGLARHAIGDAGLRLLAAGKLIHQSAYDVQHQAWSKADVVDRNGRLASVEAAASRPLEAAPEQVQALRSVVSEGDVDRPLPAVATQPPYTPVVARALQLAAIAALGEATDSSEAQLAGLTNDDDTAACLKMAKHNLFQCLAVARPHYEDIFCLGQHVMEDTGLCLAINAGVATPVEPPPPAVTVASKKPVRPTRKHVRA